MITTGRVIGPLLSCDERAIFIAAARAQLGVRFRHQGRSPLGFDCAGLVAYALAQVGRVIEDAKGYSREPQGGRLEQLLQANLGHSVPGDTPQAGDVLLMRFRGEPSHVGIAADYPHGGLMLVHAFAQVRKVVEHRLDERWMGYIVGVYRP